MNLTDEQYDNVYADIRALMAEHFPNFMFVVMDDDGDIFYEYTNLPVIALALEMMAGGLIEEVDDEDLDIDWDDEWDDEWEDA